MKRKLKIMTIVFLFIGIGLVLAVCIFLNQTQFGKNPDRVYFEVARNSPNFIDGEFRNQIPTPLFTDDSSVFSVIMKSLFTKPDRLVPAMPLPSVKTDLCVIRISSYGWAIHPIICNLPARGY